jgi:hypothetical protein
MKNIRPFGWVIIALNAYFFVSFFMNVDTSSSADSTAIGLGFIFLIFWLAIMNTFLYVLYRITGGKKRDCPACGIAVKKGLTVCPACNYDFMKAATGEPQEDLKKVIHNERNRLLAKYDDLNDFVQIIVILVLSFIAIYGGTWLMAPFSQYAADAHCGINVILHISC